MKKYALIVAGGSGTRMGTDIPKQFLMLDGEPILQKTINRFFSAYPELEIIVVLPKEHISTWDAIKEKIPKGTEILTAIGGDSRTASVRSGLNLIASEGIVAIHDAVRPFVEEKTIIDSFEAADKFGSGVAVVPLKDSIREFVSDNISRTKDRSKYVLVQTPQTFSVDLIKKAYEKIGPTTYTDDATVFEQAIGDVFLVDGSYSNIKITTPDDLK